MSSLNDAISKALDHSPHPEEDAIRALHYLKSRFGWAGTIFTRADAESQLERDLTDEEWNRLKDVRAWDEMGSIWCESGAWDTIDAALEQAGITNEENNDA